MPKVLVAPVLARTAVLLVLERRRASFGSTAVIRHRSVMNVRDHFQHTNVERDEAQHLKRYVLFLSQCLQCRQGRLGNAFVTIVHFFALFFVVRWSSDSVTRE